jgi:hypothetical protein
MKLVKPRQPPKRKLPLQQRYNLLLDALAELTAILDVMIDGTARDGVKLGVGQRTKAVRERRRILAGIAKVLGVKTGELEKGEGSGD